MSNAECWKCNGDLASLAGSYSLEDEPSYCPHCGSEIDHGKLLKKAGYNDKGQNHLYAPNFSTSGLPYQGWKIHISCSPFETYILCSELLDSLVDRGISHKVVQDRGTLEKWIGNNHKNKYKSFVIYPGIDKGKDWTIKQFPDIGRAQVFFKNPQDIKVKLNGKTKKPKGVNAVNINSNNENSKKLAKIIGKLLIKSNISVEKSGKTPEVPRSQSDEKYINVKGKESRLSYRYDIIFDKNGVQVSEEKTLEMSKKELEKTAGESWKPLADTDKVLNSDGKKVKNYREAVDVSKYALFDDPF